MSARNATITVIVTLALLIVLLGVWYFVGVRNGAGKAVPGAQPASTATSSFSAGTSTTTNPGSSVNPIQGLYKNPF